MLSLSFLIFLVAIHYSVLWCLQLNIQRYKSFFISPSSSTLLSSRMMCIVPLDSILFVPFPMATNSFHWKSSIAYLLYYLGPFLLRRLHLSLQMRVCYFEVAPTRTGAIKLWRMCLYSNLCTQSSAYMVHIPTFLSHIFIGKNTSPSHPWWRPSTESFSPQNIFRHWRLWYKMSFSMRTIFNIYLVCYSFFVSSQR